MTTPAERFSRTAESYARTMAPALRPVNEAVVRRAALLPAERVLDVGTGTGTAAALARGDGRTVVGVDAAPAMIRMARDLVAGVAFHEADFANLPFGDGAFDVVLAAHALHFAADRRAALAEWRRVTVPGGRVSLSVPGPPGTTPNTFYRDVYAAHAVHPVDRVPTVEALASAATEAGWAQVMIETDPDTALVLPDEATFRLWREIGFRGAATDHLTDADQHRLTDDMLTVTPRTPDGGYRVPFGTIYLAATKPRA